MNIYDMYLNVSKEATKQEKEYAERFLLRNEDHFGYIEGQIGMKILLGNIREAQKNGVMIEIDSIWKRCPYETYEDVTNRYVVDGKVKDSIYCEVDGYKWEFDYPDRRDYEMMKLAVEIVSKYFGYDKDPAMRRTIEIGLNYLGLDHILDRNMIQNIRHEIEIEKIRQGEPIHLTCVEDLIDFLENHGFQVDGPDFESYRVVECYSGYVLSMSNENLETAIDDLMMEFKRFEPEKFVQEELYLNNESLSKEELKEMANQLWYTFSEMKLYLSRADVQEREKEYDLEM